MNYCGDKAVADIRDGGRQNGFTKAADYLG